MTSPDELLDYLLGDNPPTATHPCGVADLIGDRKLVVYGCGDGLITFSVFVLQKFNLHPEVILDSRFSEPTMHDGFPAMSLTDYRPNQKIIDESVVVITIGKARFHPEIVAALQARGFQRIVLATEIYEYHLSHAPRGFEQLGPPYFRTHAADIRAAYALLADHHSREVFTQLLHTHVSRMPVPIRHQSLEEQYFPSDVPMTRGVSRFINCGAYDGDTVRQLHARYGKIDALICFEPDAHNFRKLHKYLEVHANQIANSIMAFPCGVWSSDSQLHFGEGQRINSSICEEGSTTIQCIALDHAIPHFRPTYLNMDIEGAEIDALHGAAYLIKHDHPDLGICVYHHPQHLWEIALYLHRLNPNYHLYLRNYTGFPAETVLYATT